MSSSPKEEEVEILQVRGQDVRVVEITFASHPRQPLWDLYVGDDLLTEDESLDFYPQPSDIADRMIDAEQEGLIVGSWEVDYSIRSLIGRDAVKFGSIVVRAKGVGAAGRAAVAWVHENDPYDDPRIDPVVEVVSVEYVEEQV